MNDGRVTKYRDCGWMLVGALLAIALLVLTTGCSPRIVEKIVKQTDTTYVERLRVDSLYQRDSVFIREAGDTVYIYTEKIRDRFRLQRDTVAVVRVDSVAVDRPVTVEVAQPLTWWQSTKIKAFWWLIGALAAALLWIFRKPILRLLRI